MPGFVIRWLVCAGALWVAQSVVGGISIETTGTLLVAAVLLGIVNAVIRPIAVVLTFPITIVTLGLFLWVINAGMLGLVAWLLPGFHIAGFGSALLGALLISFVSWVASWTIGSKGRVEVIEVRQLRR